MPIEYTYFRAWNRVRREAANPISDKQAEAMHARGDSYVVVALEQDRPVAFIEVANGFYGVSFLDELGREELMYSFERVSNGKVFLREAVFREFAGTSSQVATGQVHWFKPSGDVRSERLLASGSREEMQTTADVSGNFDSEPRFGEYSRLLVRERG